MTPMPRRSVRAGDEWDRAAERATAEHRTLSNVIQVLLRAYADGRIDAIEPPRGGHSDRPAEHGQ